MTNLIAKVPRKGHIKLILHSFTLCLTTHLEEHNTFSQTNLKMLSKTTQMKTKKSILTGMLLAVSLIISGTLAAQSEYQFKPAYLFEEPDPYELDFEIEKTEENVYKIVATIDFFDGAYVGSPLSDNGFTGLFTIDIAESEHVRLDDHIEESPRSIRMFNEREGVPVNIVNVKTTYKQVLHLSTDTDFDCGGKITFTIEPKCTFEQIPFMIKSRAGKLTIEPWGC